MSHPSSTEVSDACDQLGVPAARTGALRPLWADCPAVTGPVTTVRLETGVEPPLPQLLDIMAAASGRVVLVDLGGRGDVQCWGTVLATAAKHFGVRGALINGAARDVEGLQALGFPTYARGVFPGAVRGRLSVVGVDRAVEFETGRVDAGSFTVADASGAVFLPAADASSVLALAAELQAVEEGKLRSVRAGADPRAVFAPERTE